MPGLGSGGLRLLGVPGSRQVGRQRPSPISAAEAALVGALPLLG